MRKYMYEWLWYGHPYDMTIHLHPRVRDGKHAGRIAICGKKADLLLYRPGAKMCQTCMIVYEAQVLDGTITSSEDP
jgi:hypothetical protein